MAAKKIELPFGLTIHPRDAAIAIRLLKDYVEERKAVVEAKKITDVPNAVKMMGALKDFADAVADAVKSPAEALYNNLRFTVLPELMDADEITKLAVDGVGNVRLQDDISVKIEDKDALFKWLTENDLEDIIVENVNAQTLTATLRKRLKDGKDMPSADIVKVTPVVRAVFTKE